MREVRGKGDGQGGPCSASKCPEAGPPAVEDNTRSQPPRPPPPLRRKRRTQKIRKLLPVLWRCSPCLHATPQHVYKQDCSPNDASRADALDTKDGQPAK